MTTWWLFFLLLNRIANRVSDSDDGSFTYFLFSGLAVPTGLASWACLAWLGVDVARAAWAVMVG